MNPNDPLRPPVEGSGEMPGPYNPYANPGQQNPYPRGPAPTGPKLSLNVIGEAVDIISKHWKQVALAGAVMTVPFLVLLVGSYVYYFGVVFSAGPQADQFSPQMIFAQIVVYAASFLGYALMAVGSVGAAKIAIQHRRGGPVTNELATAGFRVFGRATGFGLAQYIVYMAGVFCCVLPGLLFAGLTGAGVAVFAQDEEATIGDAFSRSWEAMKPHMWMALLLYFLVYMLSGLGSLACLVGIIFTQPLLPIAMTLAYLDVKHGPGQSDGLPPFPTSQG